MNYKVLYRKYRPLDFNDVTGQEAVVRTLKNSIINNKISHAYIFTGPRGTGKTSLAKIFARSINCENNKDGNPCLECSSCKSFNDNPDIIEIDAASNNGVDEIRELINNVKLAPSNSKYKVYIIDEVHMLSQSAFNALLLTLEEPPAHVVFILATTDIQNVPITILSRTQRFDFTKISIDNIIKRLTYICSKEKIDITDEAISEIAYLADGGLRDALSILDQIASQTTEQITIDTVLNTFGTISNQKLSSFVEAIESNNAEDVLNLLKEFKNSSIDSKVFINKLLTVLKNKAEDIKLGKIDENRLTFDDIKKLIMELNEMLVKNVVSIDPYIILEMIVLSYINTGNDNSSPNYFPGNKNKKNNEEEKTKKVENRDTEIISTVKNEKKEEEETSKIISREIKTEENKQLNQFKAVRINNCLVKAHKKYLQDIKNNWQEFLNQDKQKENAIYLTICDTDIVVASDNYFVLVTTSDTSAALINNQVNKIEDMFNKQYKTSYKLIAVAENEWQEVKQKYIQDLNNHIKYEMQEEIVLEEKNKNSELEDMASDIFDTAKIEIVKE